MREEGLGVPSWREIPGHGAWFYFFLRFDFLGNRRDPGATWIKTRSFLTRYVILIPRRRFGQRQTDRHAWIWGGRAACLGPIYHENRLHWRIGELLGLDIWIRWECNGEVVTRGH